MQYTIKQIAFMSGVSTRTLRYYDQIGLLKPAALTETGYRIYEQQQIDLLQQILFYRELDIPLSEIQRLVETPGYDRLSALHTHLEALMEKQARLSSLIETTKKTIQHEKGLTTMTNEEKFHGFKQARLAENEARYGQELRQAYGNDAIEKSNALFQALRKDDYERMEALGSDIRKALEQAVSAGIAPDSEQGLKIAGMHKEWLEYTWADYTAEAHKGLADLYIQDARFTAYYDQQTPGCAQFLRDAVHAYLS